jgi:hypothetical protein
LPVLLGAAGREVGGVHGLWHVDPLGRRSYDGDVEAEVAEDGEQVEEVLRVHLGAAYGLDAAEVDWPPLRASRTRRGCA